MDDAQTEPIESFESPDRLPASAPLGLALASALLGIGAMILAFQYALLALGGWGALALLQAPLALGVHRRVRAGLGNRGLDSERRSLRGVGRLLLPLSLAFLGVGVAALAGRWSPEAVVWAWVIPGAALAGSLGYLAFLAGKGGHPTLLQHRGRIRSAGAAAGIALVGVLAEPRWPGADAVALLALALLAFGEGRRLRALVAVKAACGGCGSCSCG